MSITSHGVTVLGAATDEVQIEPLGSGREVGRSCILVSYKKRKIMFDCGVHPAKKGLDSLPNFIDDCSGVDLCLVTHFHVDHCAGLPYLVEQTKFCGRIFMTAATKAFYKTCMNDFIRVGKSAQDVATDEWLKAAISKIETCEYHEEIIHNGIRFQCYNAGHVLGAAMFMVDIAGVKILYTGDFSRTPDRHLYGAEIPPISPDVLIVESTYGTLMLEGRNEREEKLLRLVTSVVKNSGRCLIPVFALGRAQELLLVLEEHWEQHKELQHIPIYYASSMATKCMKQYRTFVSAMNDLVKEKHEANINPFDFKFVKPLKDAKSFNDNGPCVVLASPGMLQSGISYELFERWCGNPNNGVIIAGYCVDGTIAKEVLKKPKTITTPAGKVLQLRMGTIEMVSFSAHSDGIQTKEFIHALQTTNQIVLVHGQEQPMTRLKDSLLQDPILIRRNTKVYDPANNEKINIPFITQTTAKVLGSLASTSLPTPGSFVQGVILMSDQQKYTIVHPRDLRSFTGLPTAQVQQVMLLPLPVHCGVGEVWATLKTYFAELSMVPTEGLSLSIDERAGEGGRTEMVQRLNYRDGGKRSDEHVKDAVVNVGKGVQVVVSHDPETLHSTLVIQWTASHKADLIADVTCIALLQLLSRHTADGNILAENDMNGNATNSFSGVSSHAPLPMDVGLLLANEDVQPMPITKNPSHYPLLHMTSKSTFLNINNNSVNVSRDSYNQDNKHDPNILLTSSSFLQFPSSFQQQQVSSSAPLSPQQQLLNYSLSTGVSLPDLKLSIFRHKTLHGMLSQFYRHVRTNLITGTCTVALRDSGEEVVSIKDCIRIVPKVSEEEMRRGVAPMEDPSTLVETNARKHDGMDESGEFEAAQRKRRRASLSHSEEEISQGHDSPDTNDINNYNVKASRDYDNQDNKHDNNISNNKDSEEDDNNNNNKIIINSTLDIEDERKNTKALAGTLSVASSLLPSSQLEASSESIQRLGEILKRIYLTLFPITFDSFWCECGECIDVNNNTKVYEEIIE